MLSRGCCARAPQWQPGQKTTSDISCPNSAGSSSTSLSCTRMDGEEGRGKRIFCFSFSGRFIQKCKAMSIMKGENYPPSPHHRLDFHQTWLKSNIGEFPFLPTSLQSSEKETKKSPTKDNLGLNCSGHQSVGAQGWGPVQTELMGAPSPWWGLELGGLYSQLQPQPLYAINPQDKSTTDT